MLTVRDPLEIVFIVEDDEDDRALLARQLTSCAEVREVVTIGSGQGALEEILARAGTDTLPTLILLDVNMPGMSGFDVLDALDESDVITDETAAIVVTGSASDPDRLRALEYGRVLDYIVKPASRRDVLNILRTAARES
ncbi:MAG: two-component system response regulator [Sandaracinaceae bacterium]